MLNVKQLLPVDHRDQITCQTGLVSSSNQNTKCAFRGHESLRDTCGTAGIPDAPCSQDSPGDRQHDHRTLPPPLSHLHHTLVTLASNRLEWENRVARTTLTHAQASFASPR